jgi:hypothetical protein
MNKIVFGIGLGLLFISFNTFSQHYKDWTGFEFVERRHGILGNFDFNELMNDYTINLSEYFLDSQKLQVDSTEEAVFYYNWARNLPTCRWDFILLEQGGILTIKKGYRWDGATNGAPDKDYHHRSSLIHDAIYDLMRMNYLTPDYFELGDPSETDNDGDYNRKMTDMLYFMIAVEDGEETDKALSDYNWIRKGGWIGTESDSRLKGWKFHVSELKAYTYDRKINLSWRKNDLFSLNPEPLEITGYNLIRNGLIYDFVDATTTAYIDENVENGVLYSYQLMPADSKTNEYDWSNEEYAIPNSEAGRSFSLDGNDDYFHANNVCNDLCYKYDDTTEQYQFNYTLEAWVFPDEKPGKNTILAFNSISGGECNSIFYDSDIQKFCYYDDSCGYIESNDIFPSKKWYRIALSQDSLKNAVMYVDGIEEASFKTPVRPSHGGRFSIGQKWENDTISNLFKGNIDEVRIWKKSKSQEEILHDLYTPLSGEEPYLAGLWHFDEPQNNYSVSYWGDIADEKTVIAYDASAFGNDGIIEGQEYYFIPGLELNPNNLVVQFHNYPNPFSKQTTIKFNMSKPDKIYLAIYNLDGQEVEVLKNDVISEGEHKIQWNTDNLPEGIYYCRLQTSEFSSVVKMMLDK